MRFHELNSLRGIAALIVFFNHMLIAVAFDFFTINETFQYSPFYNFFNARFAVLFFFVLSGFVLTLPYLTGQAPRFKSYLIRRFCRIYIPFACITALTIPLSIFVTTYYSAPNLERTLWNDPLTLEIIKEHFLMTNKTVILNPPIWTLMIEMKVLIILPLLVILVRKMNIIAVVAVCLIADFTVPIFESIDTYDNCFEASSPLSALLLTFYYTQFFVIGSFLATKKDVCIAYVKRIPAKVHLLIASLIFIAPHTALGDNFLVRELGYGIFAAYIIILSITYKKAQTLLSTGPLFWLGRVSYSLYLIHVPILWTLLYMLEPICPMALILLLALIITFILSEAVYRVIEKPSHDLARKFV